jgi:hypothetical protein
MDYSDFQYKNKLISPIKHSNKKKYANKFYEKDIEEFLKIEHDVSMEGNIDTKTKTIDESYNKL